MPFIQTKTNLPVSQEQEKALKARFGKTIALLPGKSERWLMLDFEDNCRMWFGGDDAPCAYLEVKLFGSASGSSYDKLTAAITDDVCAVLGVAADRVYVKDEEIAHWGWNRNNF